MDLTMTETYALTVMLTDRGDGGISVSCSSLPGLLLSGTNKEGVIAAIPNAIKGLLEYRGIQVVSVRHSKPPAEIANGKNPQAVDMHVHQFVIEYKQAA